MASAPVGGGDCGGISFIKATRRSVVSRLTLRSFLDVYYSNRCGISRLVTSVNPVTRTTSFAGSWQSLVADHGDTRHLAFDNSGRPLLLATDGGLHATSDGGNSWTYAGGGRAGYNALQVTEIKGQLIEDVGRHDLYFGTQDNSLWSSGDRGASWANGACCEGFFIEAERRVPTSAQSKVTFVACSGGCGNFVSDPQFTSVADWSNPPGEVVGNAMILRRSVHLQGVSNSDRLSKGLAITTNLGGSWQQFARFADDRRDLPKLASPGGGLRVSMVYQAYRAPGWAPGGVEINHLLRVRKNPRLPGLASVLYPAMTNFGGLGINPTMFAWYQVYAVDLADAYHVIAPDVVNNRAMETRDGGETWTEIAQLTNLATDGGRLRFSTWMFPIITAVSFSPQSPQLVVAGTSEGGIYLSQDGGTSWSRLPGSEQVTYVTGFEWRSANDVVVSTYGRGLWRLQNRLWISRDWIDWCRRPCEIRKPWRDRGDPPPFEAGILVYDGVVLDAREEAGILRELVVTPGSSIVQVGAEPEGALPVSVSYAPRRAELGQGLREFRPPQPGWIVKGIVLDPRNRVLAAAYGDRPMAMAEPKEPEERQGSTRSPSADRPHIQLMTKRSDGSPSATPGEVFGVAGRNFPDGSVVVLVLDGKPLPEPRRVGQTGAFQAAVRAPKEHGLHRLEIRLQEQDRALDGSMFLVKHVDDFERERRRQIR